MHIQVLTVKAVRDANYDCFFIFYDYLFIYLFKIPLNNVYEVSSILPW